MSVHQLDFWLHVQQLLHVVEHVLAVNLVCYIDIGDSGTTEKKCLENELSESRD